MDFLNYLQNNIVIFDGAFGTELQKVLPPSHQPELYNLTNPDEIFNIHKSYVESGAEVISANTFGCNIKKFNDSKLVKSTIEEGLKLARKANPNGFVALDISSLGELIEPMGAMTFDEAYEAYKEIALCSKDLCDLVLIETMMDLYELKSALLAFRENSSLPIIASMTFTENQRTFTGVSVESFALTASPLCDCIGVNCSLGPKQLLPIVEKLSKYTKLPIIVQANAGLPDANNIYSVSKEEFNEVYKEFLRLGVSVIGGCCGTTPEYIKELKELKKEFSFKKRKVEIPPCVCSSTTVVEIDGVKVIGERINPTGKKLVKQALINGDYDYIAKQALSQIECGADILDVNCGLFEIDESQVLTKTVKFIQSICNAPLQIDSSNHTAIETALRHYNGKAIVNSVNGEDKVLDSVLPLIKKYGASVVGLCVNDNGVPKTIEERLEIAEKIINKAKALNIPEQDIYIDCLTLTVSAEKEQAKNTLWAINKIKSKYKVKTTLGVSNISFGMPNRPAINCAFLLSALNFGLDLPIINPNSTEIMDTIFAFNNQTEKCPDLQKCVDDFYVAVDNSLNAILAPTASMAKINETRDIFYCIEKGIATAKDVCVELLKTEKPLTVINNYLIPALNIVGDKYEKGILFLPQLIASAESAKLCFEEVKKLLNSDNEAIKGVIVMATVKGDIHDIGKNVVKTVLENYGYKIIDLGKNVDCDLVAKTCFEQNIKLAGLSALMTTTIPNMQLTIKKIKELCPDCKVMVGGAVLTEEYAKSINADFYAKDANASVKIANEFFK